MNRNWAKKAYCKLIYHEHFVEAKLQVFIHLASEKLTKAMICDYMFSKSEIEHTDTQTFRDWNIFS